MALGEEWDEEQWAPSLQESVSRASWDSMLDGPPWLAKDRGVSDVSLGGGVDRNQQVRIAALGHEATSLRFSASTVKAWAELATLLDFVQQVWSLVVAKRGLSKGDERMRRPVLDRALKVLHEQALDWLERSQFTFSMSVHASLELRDGMVVFWLRGVKDERFAASLSDEVSLLELMHYAMEIRGWRAQSRRKRYMTSPVKAREQAAGEPVPPSSSAAQQLQEG